MEFQSYNSELAIASLLFKNIFSNIRIGRMENGEEKQILVQCVIGNRSRILKSLQNPERRGMYKLPLISIERTGYSRQGDRLANLHNEVKYELASYYRKYNLMTPVPIDIDYDVTVMAKYPSDIDKIASNFMVFFNSDIYVSCEHPKYQGIKLNNQVIMSDSVSEDHASDLNNDADDVITASFKFTFKTYLFAGTEKASLVPSKIVSSVTSSFVSSFVQEIGPDEIDQFQKDHPDQAVSATLTANVTAEVTSLIDNPDAKVDVYDDMPSIYKIEFGLYAVPHKENIEEYIRKVDNEELVKHYHTDICSYISSQQYSDISSVVSVTYDPYAPISGSQYRMSAYMCEHGQALQPVSCIGNSISAVDRNCSLEPYVDKIYWTIDGVSINMERA